MSFTAFASTNIDFFAFSGFSFTAFHGSFCWKYWFADFPLQPEHLAYNSALFVTDQEYLSNLVREIINLGMDDFPLTSSIERCAFCVYRSFCNRGVHAGSFEEEETSMISEINVDIALDFEQIGEIEY